MPAAPLMPERREWTVDDLAELPSDLKYELINGRLILPSPTDFHQHVTAEVFRAVRADCPPTHAVESGRSLKVNRINEPRADVVVVPVADANRSPIPVDGALLVVEVVSPDSEFRDTVEKAEIYADAGVESYWVVDASKNALALTEFRLDAARRNYVIAQQATDVFTTSTPWAVTVDLAALAARRDELLAAE